MTLNQKHAIVKMRKIGWAFVTFVADDLTCNEAKQLCYLHNRWWKWYHYERVPPIVLRGLENDYLKQKRKRE